MKYLLTTLLLGLSIIGCTTTNSAPNKHSFENPNIQVLPMSEVKWEKLNPARGDQSPQAGTLWGNRKATMSSNTEYHSSCPMCNVEGREGAVPTGFLAKFVDGFSSPPHIHNVTYRAVVINGLVHNDDPDAAPMWMPAGSFWTQPKGEIHITSAKGTTNVALVEIDTSPYLVLPPDQAFDSGERPINVDPSNIVWVTPPGLPSSTDGPKIAYLWGKVEENGQSSGTFVKLPPGFKGSINSEAKNFRAVLIKGQLKYDSKKKLALDPGSFIGSKGKAQHNISCNPKNETIIYIRTDGVYTINPS